MTTPVPEPRRGSWIVVSRMTGRPVIETFSRRYANAVNYRRYEVLTAAQWFGRLDVELGEEKTCSSRQSR